MLQLDAVTIRQDSFELRADWSVPKGARVAVIGPSGAGKSTLLMTIAGFIEPAQGTIRWGNKALCGLRPDQRPITMVFQEHNLFPHLTVAQNVGLGLDPRLRLTDRQKAQVEDSLDRVGLKGLGRRRPGRLSGGQRSRVALARALLRDKPLLLLDEPFAALGPGLRAEMLSLVQTICTETGATLLMVTHAPDEARAIADQTIFISDGVAHPPTLTDALLDDPPPDLRAYIGG